MGTHEPVVGTTIYSVHTDGAVAENGTATEFYPTLAEAQARRREWRAEWRKEREMSPRTPVRNAVGHIDRHVIAGSVNRELACALLDGAGWSRGSVPLSDPEEMSRD